MLRPFAIVTLIVGLVCPAARAVEFFETDVFTSGTNGYAYFRIPSIVAANDGTLLAFAEGRKNALGDSGDIDTVLRRSTDNGLTWSPMQVVWSNGTGVAGNPCPVVDALTGKVLLVTNHQTPGSTQTTILNGTFGERTYQVQQSTNGGATWTDPVRITATDAIDPRWMAGGPNHGIQLLRGDEAGRLVISGNHTTGSSFSTDRAHVIYSDDGGTTWQLGAVSDYNPTIYVSETAAVELADGSLYFTSRDHHGPSAGNRAYGASHDVGESFDGPFVIDPTAVAPICQGSILRYGSMDQGDSENRIVQSYPSSPTDRVNVMVRSSFDETATWNVGRVIYEGQSAYTDLVRTADDRIGLFYERDNYAKITFASFTTAWLDEGNPPAPPLLPTIDGGRMLGFWKLDGGSGQAASDASGNLRHGRFGDSDNADANDPAWVTDAERGTVVSFSGTSYVDLSPHAAGFQDIEYGTISFWMKTTSGANEAVLSASDSTDESSEIRMIVEDSYAMWLDTRDDSSNPVGEDGYIQSTSVVNDGVWHMITATVGQDNNARIYVDGTLEGYDTEPFFTVQSLNQMALGRNVDLHGPQWHYQGLLSDVALFDRPLTAEMVAGAYALDQESELGYDLAEAIKLYLLDLGDSTEIDGLTWYALGGLPGLPGQLVELGGEYYLCLADDGTGVATVPGLVPGDANFDRSVDQTDAAALADHWGDGNATWMMGDFDGDGTVGSRDASILAANWGYHAAESGASENVPEPALLVVLGLGAVVLAAWRRRSGR
ncbi:MAG TPA: exo-alpha-sialidase [Thermoguttaceae bacterium]|nr:exo-alpha-sialidase [Thermoguttaceae bacterium]